ncbi:MAG: hypothetical protein AB7N76_18895 [Planctomycetota bacterium]
MSAPPTTPPPPRRDLLALLACVALGVLLSVFPHLQAWRSGGPPYVADPDELELYLPVAARAWHEGALTLSDPIPAAPSRTIYPWLQLGPGVLLARVLGWGPLGASCAWRLLAGALVGALVYAVLRQRLRGVALAAGLTALLLADVGTAFGKPLLRHATATIQLLRGDELQPSGWPSLLAQWRLISPALSLPWLLVTAICCLRLQERAIWRRRALAGVSVGLLVPVYFYAWTAAFLGLALWFLLEPRRRRDLLHVGWIALVVALPALVAGALMRGEADPGWLERSDKFVHIGRTEALLWPKAALLLWAVSAAWTLRARRDLLPLSCLSGAGLLLLNHQLVTGLQIENWHWQFVYGPLLSVQLALLAGGALEARLRPQGRTALLVALALALVVHLGLALALRHRELGARESQRAGALLADFAAQRAEQPALPAGLVAGDPDFVAAAVLLAGRRPLDHASVRFSPRVTEVAWEEREALDALLRGLDATAFRREQEARLAGSFFQAWQGDAAAREDRLARRLALYHATRDAFQAVVKRLDVRTVGLPRDAQPPAYLRRGWRRLEPGPRWQVWVRD